MAGKYNYLVVFFVALGMSGSFVPKRGAMQLLIVIQALLHMVSATLLSDLC
jgi:hypothetical protein